MNYVSEMLKNKYNLFASQSCKIFFLWVEVPIRLIHSNKTFNNRLYFQIKIVYTWACHENACILLFGAITQIYYCFRVSWCPVFDHWTLLVLCRGPSWRLTSTDHWHAVSWCWHVVSSCWRSVPLSKVIPCYFCTLVPDVHIPLMYTLALMYTCRRCSLVTDVHLVLMYTCCWCTLVTDIHLVRMYTCRWCTLATDVHVQLMCTCHWSTLATDVHLPQICCHIPVPLMYTCNGCTLVTDVQVPLMYTLSN